MSHNPFGACTPGSMEHYNDAELVNAIRKGDITAFDAMVGGEAVQTAEGGDEGAGAGVAAGSSHVLQGVTAAFEQIASLLQPLLLDPVTRAGAQLGGEEPVQMHAAGAEVLGDGLQGAAIIVLQHLHGLVEQTAVRILALLGVGDLGEEVEDAPGCLEAADALPTPARGFDLAQEPAYC